MTHEHNIVPGRKEGTERCTDCNYKFPCPDKDCGHLDCIETKGQVPLCYYCRRRVEGPIGNCAMTPSLVVELAQSSDDATWTVGNIRNHARAYHYACREADSLQVGEGETSP